MLKLSTLAMALLRNKLVITTLTTAAYLSQVTLVIKFVTSVISAVVVTLVMGVHNHSVTAIAKMFVKSARTVKRPMKIAVITLCKLRSSTSKTQ